MSDFKPDNTSIQVIGRMFSLLETLAHEGEAISLKSISAQTGLHPSTAHRILNDLAMGGLVERSAPGAYRLGIRLLTLGNLVKSRLDVRELAVRPMQELHRATGHPVALFMRHEDEALCMERTVTERSGVQVTRVMGLRLPLTGCAAGKVLLLNESAMMLRALCAAQGTRYEQVQAELGLIRQTHIAADSESGDPQTQVLVTPVHDDLGGIVASLALNISHVPSAPSDWQEALKTSARRISALLGWQHAAMA
jgi:DNA-binding IclR family transcriptional regulator